jgi:hypothetical protein
VLEITALDTIFPVHESLDEAIAAVTEDAPPVEPALAEDT